MAHGGRMQITGKSTHQIVGQAGPVQGVYPGPAAYGGGGGGGPSLQPRSITDVRQFPIGFESASGIAPGAQTTITVQPQVFYRSERLAFAASIATNFDLNDFKVGKDSQLAVAGNIPAEVLDNRSTGVRMSFDTAQPGILLTLLATNSTAATTTTLKAAIFGTVMD